MNIVQAIKDPDLFRNSLGRNLDSWHNWMVFLRVMYGLPVKDPADRELIQQCTGRDYDTFTGEPFQTVLIITGRRSGKSRICSLICAYEASLTPRYLGLAPGEVGLVSCISPTRHQSTIVKSYIKGVFQMSPTEALVEGGNTREGFNLVNGVRITVLAGDPKTVRGFSQVCCVLDEVAFLGLAEESKVKSDTELIGAITPALMTTGGPLIAITSPYARKGWVYQTWEKFYGKDCDHTLVWMAPSRVMNPTLKQDWIDREMEVDPAKARSEYYAEWRDDVSAFLSREVIEQVVVKDRTELLPNRRLTYHSFVDVSGGRADDAALAIGFRDGRKVIVAFLKRYKPPFNPQEVVADMARHLRQYGCTWVTGDNYGAEWVAGTFRSQGINYTKCDKPKSQLYLELLPRITSGEIELLDDPTLITQLAQLERRTRSGGKDIIDHPNRPGMHDDCANVIAGLADIKPLIRVGGYGNYEPHEYED